MIELEKHPISQAIRLTYGELRRAAEELLPHLPSHLRKRIEDALDAASNIGGLQAPSKPLSSDLELVRRAFLYLTRRMDKLVEISLDDVGPLRLFAEALMTTRFYSDIIKSLITFKVQPGSVIVEVHAGPGVGSQLALNKVKAPGVASDLDPVNLEMIEERVLRYGLDLKIVRASVDDLGKRVEGPVSLVLAVSPVSWLVDPVTLIDRASKMLESGGHLVGVYPFKVEGVNPVEPFLRVMGVERVRDWEPFVHYRLPIADFGKLKYKRVGPFTAYRVRRL